MRRRNVPSKGEIWHADGDPVSGREFKGAHYYLLVISEFALNQKLGTALCVPITSGGGLARSEAIAVYPDGVQVPIPEKLPVWCFATRFVHLI
ncbi:type II toxin-antitoxin system PemK/MazF family toxin [Photorhabdus temperata]|uniref:Growth inhibitor n=2 Tax=Photorhabdus temperata TaxID=574560 RepID=A0A081RSY5_PHOTE|nr:type II toxin-antitoxin system PemK/MazF family toxin [Photorhabdus temperata]KER01788.1 growth inhibitor [Photorhabdus temperata subsp. temperata Meg1]MCT8348405.1 type II toxin-antitoxin system PemK/MazF family toxin [Photorhabdus temperata]